MEKFQISSESIGWYFGIIIGAMNGIHNENVGVILVFCSFAILALFSDHPIIIRILYGLVSVLGVLYLFGIQ